MLSSLPQNAFTSGEWSPRLHGRTDLQKYAAACSVLENLTIMPHGAVTRRMGTEMVEAVGTDKVRLIPFVFNTEQAYVLEVTPGRIRFFRDGGMVMQGDAPYSIANPWTWDEIRALTYAQSADVMYLLCGSTPPQKLTRPGVDRFALAPVVFSGAPAAWTDGSWPRAVTFHQQRLWIAGTAGKPQTVWASKTGEFENFTTGTDDAAGLAVTLASGDVNAVRWMMSARALLIGTAGGEWVIDGGGMDQAITSKSITARRNSNYGTAGVTPCMVGTAVLHASADRRRLCELAYSFQDDGYISTDLSLLGEHITRGRLRAVAHAPDPDGIVWCVLDTGELAGLTYLRGQDVIGWHRHPTQGRVLGVAAIPEEYGSEVWLAVERKNGVCMERMLPAWDGENTNDPACWYVDCGLQYAGEPTTTVRGLEHLEGESVQVLADGATHADVVVTGGTIALDTPASLVTVGLGYRWRVAPMMPEGGSPAGTAQGKRKRLAGVTVRTYKSLGLQYGLYAPLRDMPLYDVPNREVNDAMDRAPAPHTGDLYLDMPDNWGSDGRYTLAGTLPLPATLVLLVPRLVMYE